MQKTLHQHLEMVFKSQTSAGNLCSTIIQKRFLALIRTMLIILCGVEYCATFHAARVALSRDAGNRKSLINIHNTGIPKQECRHHKLPASITIIINQLEFLHRNITSLLTSVFTTTTHKILNYTSLFKQLYTIVYSYNLIIINISVSQL